jgi:hypothetical protein
MFLTDFMVSRRAEACVAAAENRDNRACGKERDNQPRLSANRRR